ncbi:Glucitol operon repressor [Baekduia alba]|uniref:DeoR/GlpR family DNA-binding transcription regulator n=1 Tax=Baekduia alba TaxID=2997333 RepID=UPI0023416C88|nr:DeoR/GlpR family DNA-binding transcription regulator [Baekduia alba]WCB96475.1 Glucitol operon repressor [Baekduia alba]
MTTPPTRHTVPAQRRQEILRAIRSGATHVAELATSFGVSEMTVRRDLDELAREGRIERVRGGAVSVSSEPPFDQTLIERFDAKDRIGAAAAALVQDGQTVMIDIGTTTLQAARHLRGKAITVVTTSLAVYEELVPDEGIELILPGGTVRRNYQSMVGMLAESALRQLKADLLLLGTSAVDQHLDVWDSTMVEVPIKRAMIEAAANVTLLADAEKFTMAGLVRVCDASHLDRVITDGPLPAATAAAAERAGVEVSVAV